ncbi:MAG: hypothetical protein CMJ89_19510 [Planctomycetes bacterium]|nr:hypothetical protein [Planctomycetota bacterium]
MTASSTSPAPLLLLFGSLALGVLPLPSLTLPIGTQGTSDCLEELRRWVSIHRSGPRHVGLEEGEQLSSLLARLRLERLGVAAPPPELDALVELAALGWKSHRTPRSRDGREVMTRLALAEMTREIEREPEVGEYLALEFLREERKAPRKAEIVCVLLNGRYLNGTVSPLLSAARSEEQEVRELAREALSGWDLERVHHFFLDEMDRGLASSLRVGRHFGNVKEKPIWVSERLRQILGRLYVSPNWRDAARAAHLVGSLDAKRSVPVLIEALAIWDHRTEAGRGSKRIRHDIVRVLQELSGRSMGPDVESWNRWWQAVLEGRIALSSEREQDGAPRTRATFFGLRPVTDKIAFVVDRSGSMQMSFGTSGRSRYDEAIEQCLRFIEQSGQDTRFSVTLFNERGDRWRGKLSKASQANLRQARGWLERKEPSGGTGLYQGIATTLRLGRGGLVDPMRIEVDTVIVLCDGETDEGPYWVADWMRKYNEAAQLVFHCVQIGPRGDGALNDLARLSGGRFLQVEG